MSNEPAPADDDAEAPATAPEAACCPECGASLPKDAGGLCVACLLGEAMTGPPDRVTLGTLGGHELLEIIARGGMGIVYRARRGGQEVALKALPGAELMSTEARQRFRIEAEAMARLEHPGVLPVYDFGEDAGTPFFTMKLARGGTLADRMMHRDSHRAEAREAALLLAEICDAVAFAHGRGVLHRDLKPGNILFDEKGAALVSDFGLAKVIGGQSDLTRTIALMGTPNYMAPELTRGGKDAVSTAADVWSLGVILFELLAGQPPFHGDNLATVLRQISEEAVPALPRGTPRDLAVITRKALSKQPAQRYAGAREMADDLRRWLQGEAILARPVPPLRRLALWARRRPAMAALAGALLGTVVVSGVLLGRSNTQLAGALRETTEARSVAEERLREALEAEAEALLQSESLTARDRVLEIVRKLARSGPATVRTRSIAASALAMTGVTQRRPLTARAVNYATRADYAPDFSGFAASGGIGKDFFRLHTLADGKDVEQRIPAPAETQAFRYSRDGKWIAVRCLDGSLQVHRTAEPQQNVWRFPRPAGGGVLPLDWHPDGSHWLYADGTSTLRRRLTGNDQSDQSDPVFTAPARITALSFSPDGALLCLVWDGGWGMLAPAAGRLLWQRKENCTLDWPVWHASGQRVANAVQTPWKLLSIEAKTGGQQGFYGHLSDITNAAFHPHRPLLFTLARDQQLILWDTVSRQPIARQTAGVRGLTLSRDGTMLGFAPGYFGAAQWDIALPQVWRSWDGPVNDGGFPKGLDISPDGRRLLTTAAQISRVWDLSGRRLLAELPDPPRSSAGPAFWLGNDAAVRRSADVFSTERATFTLTNQQDPVLISSGTQEPGAPLGRMTDGSLAVLDTEGSTLLSPEGQPAQKLAGARIEHVSPDRQWAVCVAGGNLDEFSIRRMDTGAVVLKLPSRSLTRHRFSHNGRWLAACRPEGVVLRETGTWREIKTLPLEATAGGVNRCEFSPDSRWLAVTSGTGRITLFATTDWQPIAHLRPPGPDFQYSGIIEFCWTANSHRLLLLSHGHRVSEWDIAALEEEWSRLGIAPW